LPKNKILKGTWAEAELSKLFSNIYRYINFAIPNYFLMIANHFNVEPFALFDLMNFEYDRNKGLKSPGLTAGTCLRKDYGMINENFPQTDLILQAHKINEFMPMFIINLLKPEKITNKRIGILGYVFKKDTDDTRDSLSPKIYRYLTKLVPKIINISDYNLLKGFYNDKENQLTFKNLNEKELIKNSDVIIIAVNHSRYPDLLKKINLKKKIIIDPWRVLSKKLINNYVKG
jgi:UDP-N-acetyl-D-mannosaminuronic acid dehydrogenase